MTTTLTAPIKLTKRTSEAVAACAALGLSYWSDAAQQGCVWAVDATTQLPHLVRVDRKNSVATHACTQTSRFDLITQGPRGYVKCDLAGQREAKFDADDAVSMLLDLSNAAPVSDGDTGATTHHVEVETRHAGSHGYPHRAVCSCGHRSIGYAAVHAAAALGDAHLADVARAAVAPADEQHASVEAIEAAITAGEASKPKAKAKAAPAARPAISDRARKQILGRQVHRAVADMIAGLTPADYAEMGFAVGNGDFAATNAAHDWSKEITEKWLSYVPTDQR